MDPMGTESPVKKADQKRFPVWLTYSLLTILLWGVWGTLTKAISADIDAYMNQVLFAIGVLPVMAIVLFSRRLAGGVDRRAWNLLRFHHRGFGRYRKHRVLQGLQ